MDLSQDYASWSVLIVDDDEGIRRMLRVSLEQAGMFRVVAEATDGIEGIELADIHKPDLVVLDLNMPRMNGFAALPLIQASSPRSRVAILSALSDDAAKRATASAAGYFEKGTSVEELVERLVALMRPAA